MAGTTNGVPQRATVSRVFVLGYYDGATDGVLQLADGGSSYRFELADEADLVPGAGVRRYVLRSLPADALDRLAVALAPHLTPAWPVWCPIWQFPTPASQQQAEAAVDAILAEAGSPVLELSTADPHTFAEVRVGRPEVPAGT